MAPKKVVRQAPPRKSSGVASAFPSKLLHACPYCATPVFMCRGPLAVTPVEVLEHAEGHVAIQTCIGSDELTAVLVTFPKTYYRYHLPHCAAATRAHLAALDLRTMRVKAKKPKRPSPTTSRKAVRR